MCQAHALVALGLPHDGATIYQQALTIRQALVQPNHATEPRAGLARVALAHHDLATAQTLVNDILLHLQTGTLEGTDEPFRVYLTCYQVLTEATDPHAARILEIAYAQLYARAEHLDAETQQLFFKRVPAHAALVAAWEQNHPSSA